MYLQNRFEKLNANLPNTWDVISRIQLTLALDDRSVADLLLLSMAELVKQRERRGSISADKIFNCAEALNLSFEGIATGEIDYPCLAKHSKGLRNELPERYALHAYGKRRAPSLLLNFIEENFGWQERVNILRRFQLNESIFAHQDESISFHFSADLCEYLSRYKMSQAIFPRIGLYSFLHTNIPAVTEELRQCATVQELYEKMCMVLVPKYFEKNFIYTISQINQNKCYLSARPNPDFQDQIKTKIIGNPETALLRVGIAAAYPTILGLPIAQVKQVASIYEGAPEMKYEIDFTAAQNKLSVLQNTQPQISFH